MSSSNSIVTPAAIGSHARPTAAKKPRPAQSHLALKSLIISLSIVGTIGGWSYLAWQQHELDALAQKENAALSEPRPHPNTVPALVVPVAAPASMATALDNPPIAESAVPRMTKVQNAAQTTPSKRSAAPQKAVAAKPVKPAKAKPTAQNAAAVTASTSASKTAVQATAQPVLREVPVVTPAKARVRSRSSR